MRIGIFGGSFDPIHSGHVRVAEAALSKLRLDRLIVVPAAVSPFKQSSPPAGRQYDRLMLARVAFNGCDRVTVDDRELRRGGVSYAIDTVREIAAENPGCELFFLIGEDSVAGLGRWREYEALKALCRFETFARTAESSTEVRRRIAAGESFGDLVPEAVELFIRHGVVENDERRVVAAVREGLVRKGGHCPCRIAKTSEFFCPCAEFRHQLEDPAFAGLCHCRLYRKPGHGVKS